MRIHDLIQKLNELRVEHLDVIDAYSSCPYPDSPCNCVADEHNQKIDNLIQQLNQGELES